jgi:hypothetical protein
LYFKELQENLIGIARGRVKAGQLTERGLARMCGVSQPQLHNVLKNIRGLSTDSADRLMHALNLTVPDLAWGISTEPDTDIRAIPIVKNRIGPGSDAVLTATRGYIRLPQSLIGRVVDPVAARLGPDLVLPKALAAHDLVLLDQNPAIRSAPGCSGIWVVSESSGLRVRYLRTEGSRLLIANEATLEDPRKWQAVPLERRNILDVVRARIVWMGREMERESAGPADPAGQSH